MTGCVHVDMTCEDGDIDQGSRDRRALSALDHCPAGARVIVDIGGRAYVSQDAAAWIHGHADRLLIEIVGSDPMAVARFVRAARAGDWSAVA